MNNKIYFNNKFIEFYDTLPQNSQNQSIRFYDEFNEQKLDTIISDLLSENSSQMSGSGGNVYTPKANFEQVLDYLKKKFYYIEAAGGLIRRGDDFLFIFRLGKWDLPKGKLDLNESAENAAVRECEEECAVKDLSIEKKIGSTFHTYRYKDKYALKQTYWYYMTTDYNKKLVPQTEENIEEVRWFKKNEIEKTVFANCYFTIRDVVDRAFELLGI